MKKQKQKEKQRERERERGIAQRIQKRACYVASLFTRIPFTIDPLCTRLGVVRFPFPSLLGLFIRLPLAAALFKAQPYRSSFSFLPDPQFPLFPSFLLSHSLVRSAFLLLLLSHVAATGCQTTREIVCITSPVCRTLAPTLPNLLSNLATTDTRQYARNAMRSNRTLLVFCHGLEIHTIYTTNIPYMYVQLHVQGISRVMSQIRNK